MAIPPRQITDRSRGRFFYPFFIFNPSMREKTPGTGFVMRSIASHGSMPYTGIMEQVAAALLAQTKEAFKWLLTLKK
jgi:hypothetical protein